MKFDFSKNYDEEEFSIFEKCAACGGECVFDGATHDREEWGGASNYSFTCKKCYFKAEYTGTTNGHIIGSWHIGKLIFIMDYRGIGLYLDRLYSVKKISTNPEIDIQETASAAEKLRLLV